MNQKIEIKLNGSDITPGFVRSVDLAKLMDSFESMVSYHVFQNHREDIEESDIFIGLSNIKKGSLILEFIPSMEDHVTQSLQDIFKHLESCEFKLLPNKIISKLRDIRSISKHLNASISFSLVGKVNTELGKIDAETKIEEPRLVREFQTIYGEITRVGGVNPDKSKIQFRESLSGRLIYGNAKRKEVEQAGKMLYQFVGLRGIASLDAFQWSVEEFEVLSIIDMNQSQSSRSIQTMKDKYGKYFDTITDVEKYCKSLRQN
jgi:hypothetical protein